MIDCKLYCIMYTLELSDEPIVFHTASVDMDYETALALAKDHAINEYGTDDNIDDILEYSEVIADGVDIFIEVKEAIK